MSTQTLDGIFYKNFEESSTYILEMLSKFIDVNTFLITSTDGVITKVIRTFNKEEQLILEGMYLPLSDAF